MCRNKRGLWAYDPFFEFAAELSGLAEGVGLLEGGFLSEELRALGEWVPGFIDEQEGQ